MSVEANVRTPWWAGAKKLVLAVIALIAVYFAYVYVLPYLSWSESSYGYYWPFRTALLLHVVGGALALLMGVVQLWSGVNGVAMGAHPITGRVYVAGVLLGSIGGWLLAVTSALYGFAWAVALASLATAWFAVTAMALFYIRKRNIRLHRQWMIRSYIITFAFVTFRLITDYVPYEAWWGISQADMSVAVVWPVWVLPLLVYETVLQYREARR